MQTTIPILKHTYEYEILKFFPEEYIMKITSSENTVAIVTGGASGLGLATAKRLLSEGAIVVIVDLPSSNGIDVAKNLGDKAHFFPADVTQASDMATICEKAATLGSIRILVHCAGIGGPIRILNREGEPGSLEKYENIVRVNLIGTFNTIAHVAAAMNKNEPTVDGEKGVCVLTASIAAYEGQIGQIAYASSKAGVVGMTLVAARDLASKNIRVCTIAPGIFDTPMLARVSEPARKSLADSIPNPRRLGNVEEYANLALHIIENQMLNGETIRLDGALRMAPR